MSKLEVRDSQIIEEDLNKLLETIVEHKETFDDQCEQLVNQSQVLVNPNDEFAIQNFNNANVYQSDANYFKEFWRYYILNEMLIKKVNEVTNYNQKLNSLTDDLDDLQNELLMSFNTCHKKKNRRTSQEIQKCSVCPYENCNKQYGSDVSLNLHIKLKHDGGNKTDREKYAKQLIQAQECGMQLPEISIKFPPGYLDQFKCQMKKERSIRSVKSSTKEENKVTIFYDE